MMNGHNHAPAKPCCGNCNAWMATDAEKGDGVCRARPPQSFLAGLQPRQGLQGMAAEPIHTSAFPSIRAIGWCREWRQAIETK